MNADGEQQHIAAFIDRWTAAVGKERSYYQAFLNELCDLIEVDKPGAGHGESYQFERTVLAQRVDGASTSNFIDLFKRGCFVLEAKQSPKRIRPEQLELDNRDEPAKRGRRTTGQWDALMRGAREQAERYAKRLPVDEGWPPFLIVVDVGHVIELYADFSLQGKHYAQFPDRTGYRIYLDDLRQDDVRERLRLIWTDPASLNPAKRTAEVTRDIAKLLAELSKRLERRLSREAEDAGGPDGLPTARRAVAEKVALFLMRCLFTMFAEDVGLIGRDAFTQMLERFRGKAGNLHLKLETLWREMDSGGWSNALENDVRRFNGGLFKDSAALPVDEDDLDLLIIAAKRDWQQVEPAIFGTLLEQALDPRERHALGAYYTPRAYVERLVQATVIEPLQEDWRNVQTAAAQLMAAGDAKRAQGEVRKFHAAMCEIKVLDPACGTGNFLYVAMELMKRLEGEVIEALADLGDAQANLELDRHTVDPHQFLGLEINPRAVAIAELVLWIGYLQWHFRTRGRTMPAEPVLRDFANIREQDAILKYDSADLLRDESGRPVSRWDGISTKPHPVTGEAVPDESKRVELCTYRNPRPASWPRADFIVGNPPFIGGKDMRRELGDGYAEACWKVGKGIPGGADFVMHFWDMAAEAARRGQARRFGLITTNSITQKFSRRVIEKQLAAKKPLSLLMAIPDHPWMKSADKAAVRIAMTVGAAGKRDGRLLTVTHESGLDTDAPQVEVTVREGNIHADLSIGANMADAERLIANAKISCPGVKLHGAGFIVTPMEAAGLGLGKVPGLENHILGYRNGRDLTARPRGVMVIDLFPLSEAEVRDRFPATYQWVLDRVKPERDTNRRESRRKNWWIFGEPISTFRPVLKGLPRYIATVETSKHRFFQFLDASVRPDNMLVNFGLDDAFFLGVLSSRVHVTWALAAGGRLGVGNDPRYNKTRCFDPFPFPDPADDLKARIRDLGERLDAHRKEVQDEHKQLTMTKLYNLLEKLRAGEALDAADKDIYDAGLVGVLKQIHDGLDAAVAEAYGWPADLSDEDILERLVALNNERAAEEARGHVRWLRPDFQAPDGTAPVAAGEQLAVDLVVGEMGAKKPTFPATLPEQVAAVRTLLDGRLDPVTPLDLARTFRQGRKVERKVAEVLAALVLLGQAERDGDRFLSLE